MNETLQRAALGLFAGVIVISLAIQLAGLTWHLAGDASSGSATAADAGPVASAATPTDLSPILTLAPFGSATATTPAALAETSLGLVLMGVLLAEPSSQSTAIIAGSDAVPHLYGVGDALPGGATLEEVRAESVTLNIAGRLESLSFPKTAPITPGVAAIRNAIPASAGGGGAPAAPASPARKNDPDAIAQDFRERIASNPKTVLADVGLAPTGDGYRFEDSMMPELRKAGLQPGDVVVRVNGNKVGNVERDRSLFDEVVASGRARVEIMREGNLIVMSFPLR